MPLHEAKYLRARGLCYLMEPFHCDRLSFSHTGATPSTVAVLQGDTVTAENILMCQVICIVNRMPEILLCADKPFVCVMPLAE